MSRAMPDTAGGHDMPTVATFDAWNERLALEHDQDAYFTSSNPVIRMTGARRLRSLLRALHPSPGESVLDIGCGDGNLLQMFPPCRKTGVDLSRSMVERASARLGADATVLRMNAEHLDFPNAFFDKIACSEVLEHTLHPDAVLREIARVLAPGGTAAVSVPHERLIKLAKRLCGALGLRGLLSLSPGRDVMPLQNPWHLHDADLSMLCGWIPPSLAVVRIDRIPFPFLPLHYVAVLRNRADL